MIDWHERRRLRLTGDDEREAMSEQAVEAVRAALARGERRTVVVEKGDAVIVARPSDVTRDAVEVLETKLGRRGEDAPRRGL